MTSVYFAKSKKASPERAPTTLSSDDGNTKYCIWYLRSHNNIGRLGADVLILTAQS